MAIASEEDILLVRTQTTTLSCKAWDAIGDISMGFTFSPISKTRPVKDVYLESNGQKAFVPSEVLKNQPELNIETARVSAEAGYDKDPWVYLSFTLMQNPKKRFYFAFQSGVFKKTFTHGNE